MRGVRRRLLAASAAVTLFMGLDLALVSPGPTISHAVEPPMELKWHQLVPPAPPPPPKSFLSGRPTSPINPAGPHDGAAPRPVSRTAAGCPARCRRATRPPRS